MICQFIVRIAPVGTEHARHAGVASVGIVEGATLKEQWSNGDILTSMTSFRVGATQFRDPSLPWVRDLRVRQAIMHMSDRQALVDSLTYGLSLVADTAIAPDDPAFRLLYPVDCGLLMFDDLGHARGFGPIQAAALRYDRAGGLAAKAGFARDLYRLGCIRSAGVLSPCRLIVSCTPTMRT